MNVLIREATPDDAARMLALMGSLTEEQDVDIPLAPGEFTLTVEQERAVVSEYAASENSVFLVATHGTQLIGMLNCQGGKRKATRHAVTLGISVHKEWRNQGVGAALLTHAITWAHITGIVTRIELDVYARNARAIHLYEKYSFVVEGRRKNAIFQNGQYLDGLIMALIL